MGLPSYAMNQPSFPEMYEQWLVPFLFRPWAELTLGEPGLFGSSPNPRILDVACGTGIVARVAKERLGDAGYVAGVDLSKEMIDVARRSGPGIDWREGDAAALPLNSGEQFNVLVCQQGLQFFPDKSAAVAEMRRALAPGGKLAVTTWRSDEEIPFFGELRKVAERHLGPVPDRRHSLGDAETIEALLHEAGLQAVRTRTVALTVRFPMDAPLLQLNTMALVGMSPAAKAMDAAERQLLVKTIIVESLTVVMPYMEKSGPAFELKSNLATAQAPE